jgi:hypothetical protein
VFVCVCVRVYVCVCVCVCEISTTTTNGPLWAIFIYDYIQIPVVIRDTGCVCFHDYKYTKNDRHNYQLRATRIPFKSFHR